MCGRLWLGRFEYIGVTLVLYCTHSKKLIGRDTQKDLPAQVWQIINCEIVETKTKEVRTWRGGCINSEMTNQMGFILFQYGWMILSDIV